MAKSACVTLSSLDRSVIWQREADCSGDKQSLDKVTFSYISKEPTGLHYRYMYLGAVAGRANALTATAMPRWLVGWWTLGL